MAKRLVVVIIIFALIVLNCGCVERTKYKTKTVERDEALEYEKACFEKAKAAAEAEGYEVLKEEADPSDTGNIRVFVVNTEGGQIRLKAWWKNNGFSRVNIRFDRTLNEMPNAKCEGMNTKLYLKIINIYSGIEITDSMFDDLLHDPSHVYTDSVFWLKDEDGELPGFTADGYNENHYYHKMFVQHRWDEHSNYLSMWGITYSIHANRMWDEMWENLSIVYDEEMCFIGYLGCCIEGMNKEVTD